MYMYMYVCVYIYIFLTLHLISRYICAEWPVGSGAGLLPKFHKSVNQSQAAK